MKQRRSLLALMLAAFLPLASFQACGDSPTSPTPEEEDDEPDDDPGDGVAVYDSQDPGIRLAHALDGVVIRLAI